MQLISIITVVLNCRQHIEQTIQSVINQTYNNIEYIIIDGGSTDGTLDIIRNYDHAIDYWISEKDQGIYSAMNKGLRVVANEESYVLFLNAGDFFDDHKIISDISFELNDCDFVYGKIKLEDGDFSIIAGKKVNLTSLTINTICHQTIFVKKALYNQLGGFSEKYQIASDYEFVLRVFNTNIKTKYIDKVISTMRLGGISDRNYLMTFKEKSEIIKNNVSTLSYYIAVFHIYFIDIPFNLTSACLERLNLLSYWRRLKKYGRSIFD